MATPQNVRDSNRRSYEKHRDARLAYQREYNANNRQRRNDQARLSKYGVTPTQFTEMLTAQGGCCAICLTTTPRGKGTWKVDHCHTSGSVRGLLCNECNIGLGKFGDNPDALEAAASYLRKHNEPQSTYNPISPAHEPDRPEC